MTGLAEQYLDLSDAWLHEPRDSHGRWVTPGAVSALPLTQQLRRYPGGVLVGPRGVVAARHARAEAIRQQAIQRVTGRPASTQALSRAVVESKLYTAAEFSQLQNQINDLRRELDQRQTDEARSVRVVHLSFIAAGVGVALILAGVSLPAGVALLLAALPQIGSELGELKVVTTADRARTFLAHPVTGFRTLIGHPPPRPVLGMANDQLYSQATALITAWLERTGLVSGQASEIAEALVSEWLRQNASRVEQAGPSRVSLSLTDQYLDLAREAWRYEPRGLHGEWEEEPGNHRYLEPDPSRLVNPNARDFPSPADHPWFKAHPVSAANIVRTYDLATPEERRQGMRWYDDAHNIAAMIGGGNADKGAGLLAAYSPQTSWPVNMFNAARAAQEGRALGPGDGMITRAMQRTAQRILNGEPASQVMGHSAPKINAFAQLIVHGGDAPDDPIGQVVMDRHAMSVAAGERLTTDIMDASPVDKKRYYEHIADVYRHAAHQVSARGGEQVAPYQMQAITWLHQQAANQAEDEASGRAGAGLARGRRTAAHNAWQRWGTYARQHHVPVEKGTTILSQLYGGTLTAQLVELAGWEDELRDPHGMWTETGGVVHYHGSLGIDRADMPQLSGTLADGSYASSAEMYPRFMAHLQARGIHATTERVPAGSLKPTQTTGSTKVIHGIADSLVSGGEVDVKPAIVSSDDRILDGHHTWAARQLAARSRPDLGAMTVIRAGVPIRRLIAEATAFSAEQGIRRRATGQVASPAYRHHADVGTSTITGQFLDLASEDGHHIPGTPFTYHHGWVPVTGGPDTLTHYTLPGGGIEPGRAELHRQIVDSILAGHQPQQYKVATFLGGGTAAGKSTMLASSGPGAPDSAVIDADAIKGMLPEYQQMTSAGDPRAASLVHEESSTISKQAVDEAIRRGLNYTLDGTGDSSYAKLAAKVGKPRAAGYQTIAKYVTADTDTAVQRARDRAQQTGRMVPETVIREIHAGVSGAYRQAAENGLFDRSELWDSNGPAPKLIARKEPGGPHVVLDEDAYQRFLAKEHE